MAWKESRESNPNKDRHHEESGIDELVDETMDFLDVNKVEDERGKQEPDAKDDFYRPFQEMPDTDADKVPEEEKIQQERPTDETGVIRNSDKNK